MKKYLIFLCIASLFGITACEDDFNKDNFKGLEEMTKPENVLDKDYSLTEADYTTIGGLKVEGIDSADLKAVEKNQYLTSATNPRVVLPVFLAKNWKTASLDATLRLTFNYVPDVPDYLTAIATSQIYELTTDDYTTIWGEAGNEYLTSGNNQEGNLSVILEKAITEPTKGQYVVAAYQYLDNESGAGDNQDEESIELLNESFADGQGNFTINDVQLPSGSTYVWKADKNKYMKASAYVNKANRASESWLISPLIDMTEVTEAVLTFEHAINFGSAASYPTHMTLWVAVEGSEDWQQLTIPNLPTEGSWTFLESGEIDLSAYAGKSVKIAFKYLSTDAAAATWEVKNVAITGSVAAGEFEIRNAVYAYDGETWAESQKVVILNPVDYKTMGGPEKGYFSTEIPADNYLPQFLHLKYPYAQGPDTLVVMYNYSNKTTLKADEYVLDKGVWKANTQPVTVVTEQYALGTEGWVYSPDVVVILKPGKRVGTGHFQALTDWVWENVDQKEEGLTDTEKGKGYVTSFGNNDYYYGGSEYQNNFDFRPAAWREQMPKAYEDMTDEELTALMWKRLPKGIENMLNTKYADVDLTNDPVHYVLKFGIYGIGGSSATKYYSIRCKLVGKGKFSYVENSLKEISSL